MTDPNYLLSDEQMRHYITRGYVVLKTGLPKSFHEQIYQRTSEVMEKEGNPGNNILPRVPELHRVFADPTLRGALSSVLGPDHIMHSHRHCHVNKGPGDGGGVHKDSYWGYRRVRSHRTRWAMLLYYPQDCPEEIGPTGVVPGSQTYEHKESWEPLEQILPCVGEAGTAVLIHFDIWHRACPNLTEKTRFMMKFQFTRMTEPTAPTWNNRSAVFPGGNGSGDRHRGLWTRMWNWHRGDALATVDGTGASGVDAVAQLRDGDLEERMAAADSLGAAGAGDGTLDALRAALRDEAEPVRLNAAYSLAAIGTPAFKAEQNIETIDDLLRAPLIHLHNEETDWTTWTDWFRALGRPAPKGRSFKLNNYTIALQAAQDDVGAMLGWDELVGPLLEDGRLIKLVPDEIASPMGFYLRVHPRASEKARIFVDWLINTA